MTEDELLAKSFTYANEPGDREVVYVEDAIEHAAARVAEATADLQTRWDRVCHLLLLPSEDPTEDVDFVCQLLEWRLEQLRRVRSEVRELTRIKIPAKNPPDSTSCCQYVISQQLALWLDEIAAGEHFDDPSEIISMAASRLREQITQSTTHYEVSVLDQENARLREQLASLQQLTDAIRRVDDSWRWGASRTVGKVYDDVLDAMNDITRLLASEGTEVRTVEATANAEIADLRAEVEALTASRDYWLDQAENYRRKSDAIKDAIDGSAPLQQVEVLKSLLAETLQGVDAGMPYRAGSQLAADIRNVLSGGTIIRLLASEGTETAEQWADKALAIVASSEDSEPTDAGAPVAGTGDPEPREKVTDLMQALTDSIEATKAARERHVATQADSGVCETCGGSGDDVEGCDMFYGQVVERRVDCPDCGGSGRTDRPTS